MGPESRTSLHSMDRHALALTGCEPTPLASYLKALGILRLVSEQKDPTALGWWADGNFYLDSHLDRDQLVEFFLEAYHPTPILGPWNGGSGFYPKDNTDALDPIRDGSAARYMALRSTIIDIEALIESKDLIKRPDAGPAKTAFLTELRSIVDDGYLNWIDAAVTLSEDDVLYPPLLGTGGNDGRLDFTNNFMKNLVRLIDPDTGAPEADAQDFMAEALFRDPAPGLQDSAIGQFAPDAAGGLNAESGFSGGPRVNPWDFVLMLEGAILLAASTSRRRESRQRGVLAYPFTVRSIGAGSGGTAPADEGSARAESWMPLWSRPASLLDVGHVLSEGRVVVDQRMSSDGLDAIRAIAKLGVDRGIDSFQRFGYLQRSGRSYLATPLGEVRVQRNPDADLIDDLDRNRWLSRFRRLGNADGAPTRLARLLHQLEDALFDLAQTAGSPAHVQRCLIILGRCQRYLSRSPASRESCPSVPALDPKWMTRADDGGPEFRIAAGLASLRGLEPVGDGMPGTRAVLTTAEYMAPVGPGSSRRWTDGSDNRVVWAGGPLERNLGRMMVRRMLDQKAGGLGELPLYGAVRNNAISAAEWLRRPEWDRGIGELMQGLALIWKFPRDRGPGAGLPAPIPVFYTLLKPLFLPRSRLANVLAPHAVRLEEVSFPQPAEIVRLLLANRTAQAMEAAQAVLRSRGLTAPRIVHPEVSKSGPRLLGALMLPVSERDLRRLFSALFDLPELRPKTEASS